MEAGGAADLRLTTSAFCAAASLWLKRPGPRGAVPAAPAWLFQAKPAGLAALGLCPLPARPPPALLLGWPQAVPITARSRSQNFPGRESPLISRCPNRVRAGVPSGAGRA